MADYVLGPNLLQSTDNCQDCTPALTYQSQFCPLHRLNTNFQLQLSKPNLQSIPLLWVPASGPLTPTLATAQSGDDQLRALCSSQVSCDLAQVYPALAPP